LAQQDDYYYEIQLSNKQLVFYFLAGATGLILSFLAGVMVGRGVDSGPTHDAVAAVKPAQEERIVAEESPKPSPPAAEELTYAQRLDGDKNDDTLEKPGAKTPPKVVDKPSPKPSAEKADKASDKTPEKPKTADKDPEKPAAKATPAPRATPSAKPTTSPRPTTAAAKPVAGTFTIQVGAFKDKETADSVVGRLKKKGFSAFVVPPEGDGLFNVRVGAYPARADAERIQAKLRDEEKFKPFIVKN